MRRSAFTLIEMLVIVAIIGIMATGAVLSVTSGQRAYRVKGATRDAFASIRQARSTALVTQKPAIITYSTVMEDGEARAVIEITSAKLIDTKRSRPNLQTITGAPVRESDDEVQAEAGGSKSKSKSKSKSSGSTAKSSVADAPPEPEDEAGGTLEEYLFAPIDEEVLRGMRVKVLRGDEYLEARSEERPKTKVSVFSNVDYLLGRYKDAKSAAEKEKKADSAAAKDDAAATPAEDAGEPVSIVWETNGRVEPHQVWIYPDGARPEDGLSIKVDAFGGAKVVSGDGREE